MQCWNLSWNDGCSVAQSGVLQIPTHLSSGSWRVSFSRRDRRASGEDLGCCQCGPVASEENRQVYAKRHTLGFIKVKDWSVLPTNPHCKNHLLRWEFNDVYAYVKDTLSANKDNSQRDILPERQNKNKRHYCDLEKNCQNKWAKAFCCSSNQLF